MSIEKSEYMGICDQLGIEAYVDVVDKFNDDRMWSLGEILEQISYQIRELKEGL